MKNISQILANGKMNAMDIVKVLIHNDLAYRSAGKQALDETEMEALKRNITKLDEFQHRKYVSYWDKYEKEIYLSMDLQTMFLNTQIDILKAQKLGDYLFWKGAENQKPFQKFLEKEVRREDVLEFILSNTGIEYDKLIQGLTWESLDDIMRYNLEALYPDVKTEINYLKDEERLYIFFKNHPVPTDADFKKLAEEITNSIPWDIIEHFRKIKLDYATRFLDGYTASFQGRDIIRKMAEYTNTLVSDEEDIKDLVLKTPNLREAVKQTIYQWLKNGLFQTEYLPLCKSTGVDTVNKFKTKYPHNITIQNWVEAKIKVEEKVNSLIESGDLSIVEITEKFDDLVFNKKIISGVGIYNLKEDFKFKTEYLAQIEKISEFMYCIYVINNRSFIQTIPELLSFRSVYEELSVYFDLDYMSHLESRIKEVLDLVDHLVMELNFAYEKLLDQVFMESDYMYLIEIDKENLFKKLKQFEPVQGKLEEGYRKKLKLKNK